MSGSGGPLDGYYSQLGQLRSVTDGWRTMPGPVRPLSETTNELTQGAPTWADAWEHNKAAYQDWAEKQRIAGVAAGEIDPETGWPTPAGARSAATSAAMGLVMGSTAPEFRGNPLRVAAGAKSGGLQIGESEMLGASHGQKDLVLRAHDAEGNQVGHVKWSEYEGEPQIDYVQVEPRAQRQGVGTALVKQLADEVGGYHKIGWSNQTDEGAALKSSLDKQFLLPSGAPRAANPLRAYHGSPHEFPPTERNPLGEFDPARVGSGQGAQAYGTGAGYLAENEGIARSYRDELSLDRDYQLSDNTGHIPGWLARQIDQYPAGHEYYNGTIDGGLKDFRGRLSEAQEELKTSNQPWNVEDRIAGLSGIVDRLERLRSGDVTLKKPGHMYEAEVHIDPEHMLHWDLPLSQQSKYVQERLQPENLGLTWGGPLPGRGYHGWLDANGKPAGGTLWKTSEPQPLFKADQTGEDIYRRLHDDKAAVSERLRDAGIPALRYRDANSRSENGQPQHNMVVFDPATINIVRRYGIGALISGGAAVGAAQGEE